MICRGAAAAWVSFPLAGDPALDSDVGPGSGAAGVTAEANCRKPVASTRKSAISGGDVAGCGHNVENRQDAIEFGDSFLRAPRLVRRLCTRILFLREGGQQPMLDLHERLTRAWRELVRGR